jgi:hypothetical protein
MTTLSQLVHPYFDEVAISNGATEDNLIMSRILLVRLPINVIVDVDYLIQLLETGYNIGSVYHHTQYTRTFANNTFQHIFIIHFKWIIIGSNVVKSLHDCLMTYGYNDICINYENYIIPIRIFYDVDVEMKMISIQMSSMSNNQIKKQIDIVTASLKKDLRKNYESYEGIVEADIIMLNENTLHFATKLDSTEKRLEETEIKLQQTTAKLLEVEDSLKWWRKGLYNRIKTLENDLADKFKELDEQLIRRKKLI